MRLRSSDQKLQNKKPQQQKSVTDCVAMVFLFAACEKNASAAFCPITRPLVNCLMVARSLCNTHSPWSCKLQQERLVCVARKKNRGRGHWLNHMSTEPSALVQKMGSSHSTHARADMPARDASDSPAKYNIQPNNFFDALLQIMAIRYYCRGFLMKLFSTNSKVIKVNLIYSIQIVGH